MEGKFCRRGEVEGKWGKRVGLILSGWLAEQPKLNHHRLADILFQH